MRIVEVSGKTVEEAILEGLKKLEVSREEVEVEVLEEGSKGLFGLLGSKLAKVRITKKEKPIEAAKDFLMQVCSKLGVTVTIEHKRKGIYDFLSLSGNNVGILIGRRGETLDALQYLVNLVINKEAEERARIILDVEGYRKRREQTLTKLAHRLAEKVKRTRQKVVLEPMNPHERRVIHTALQQDEAVFTCSEGEEPYRKVVISIKE